MVVGWPVFLLVTCGLLHKSSCALVETTCSEHLGEGDCVEERTVVVFVLFLVVDQISYCCCASSVL